MRPDRRATTFVIDEDTGPSAAQGIRDAHGVAVLLTDQLGPGVKDVDWLPRVSDFGDALVTRDGSMPRDHADVFKRCGVHVFVITAKDLRFDEIRELMTAHHAAMCRLVQKHGVPFLARVNRTGIKVVYSAGRRGGIRKD